MNQVLSESSIKTWDRVVKPAGRDAYTDRQISTGAIYPPDCWRDGWDRRRCGDLSPWSGQDPTSVFQLWLPQEPGPLGRVSEGHKTGKSVSGVQAQKQQASWSGRYPTRPSWWVPLSWQRNFCASGLQGVAPFTTTFQVFRRTLRTPQRTRNVRQHLSEAESPNLPPDTSHQHTSHQHTLSIYKMDMLLEVWSQNRFQTYFWIWTKTFSQKIIHIELY